MRACGALTGGLTFGAHVARSTKAARETAFVNWGKADTRIDGVLSPVRGKNNRPVTVTASFEKQIAKILTSRQYRHIVDGQAVPAAVLVLLFERETDYHVLLTKRSDKVACHKGEISFPGGTVDLQDRDLLHTALREGYEEVGVHPEDVAILGRLDDMSTVTTGFVISPYVGVIAWPYPFQVNTNEIAELIFVPLKRLKDIWHCGKAQKSGSKVDAPGPSFYYEDNFVWGATARILKQFADLVFTKKCILI